MIISWTSSFATKAIHVAEIPGIAGEKRLGMNSIFGGKNCPLDFNSSLVVSPLLLVMGVDEPNKLGRGRRIGYNRKGEFFRSSGLLISTGTDAS